MGTFTVPIRGKNLGERSAEGHNGQGWGRTGGPAAMLSSCCCSLSYGVAQSPIRRRCFTGSWGDSSPSTPSVPVSASTVPRDNMSSTLPAILSSQPPQTPAGTSYVVHESFSHGLKLMENNKSLNFPAPSRTGVQGWQVRGRPH